ncbi:hypothetical protein FRC17_008529 [Serendipita sp. 399]|nr:hypothetical protein FRC17_008529 [Serendipita sp. 399]
MSDDEFDLDDGFLDAATLAVLDAVEQRFAHTEAATQHVPYKPPSQIPSKPSQDRFIRPPPPKRLRTNEWNVTTRPNRDAGDSDDDIPNIAIVAQGGKYRIVDPVEGNPRSESFATRPGKQIVNLSQRNTVLSQRVIRPVPSTQAFRGNGIARPATQRQPDVQASQARYAAITAALKDTNEAEEELAELRIQYSKLQREHEAALASAKAAETARLTKEGEVITLRRNMAKMAETHSEKVSKLQAEKVAEEEKRKQMERQKNQEMERQRTNLELRVSANSPKRQELETSARKPSWSIRKPTQAYGNNRSSALETPIRSASHLRIPTSGGVFRQPTAKADVERSRGTVSKSTPVFPGFVDSFRSGSPVKKRHPVSYDAGNGEPSSKSSIRPNMEDYFSPINIEPPTPFSSHSGEVPRPGEVVFPDESQQETDPGPFDGRASSQMNGELTIGESMDDVAGQLLQQEEGAQEEIVDWANACFRLLFTHTSSPSCQLTLQMLLSTDIPPDRPDRHDEYIDACSMLFEAVASRSSDLTTLLRPIFAALMKIGQILVDIAAVNSLSALFDLLATICVFVPGSTSLLLSHQGTGDPPSISIMVQTFRDHSLQKEDAGINRVVDQAIHLTEILCLTSSQDEISQVKTCVLGHPVISDLLDTRQSKSTMHSTIRCLSVITMYPDGIASFLSYPSGTPNTSTTTQDPTRVPQVERLAHILAEPMDRSLRYEAIQYRHYILRCFTQVTFSSPEYATKLAQCQAVLPSFISTLNGCTNIIWDSNEDAMETNLAIGYLQIIFGILQLLHYIIFKPEVEVNIQQVIQRPPLKFNGLDHMFVVALGRLSYAETPEWNDVECGALGESIADMARDVLEEVISGPEVDIIWASYQDSREGSDTEEDEMSDTRIDGTDDEEMLDFDDM